ncbi:unnamed protein product [Amoebophrya sp. A25]|nr:unnamed protein product [Amoebophrya sp. A25]|eukprot:GSA25T00008245001.1
MRRTKSRGFIYFSFVAVATSCDFVSCSRAPVVEHEHDHGAASSRVVNPNTLNLNILNITTNSTETTSESENDQLMKLMKKNQRLKADLLHLVSEAQSAVSLAASLAYSVCRHCVVPRFRRGWRRLWRRTRTKENHRDHGGGGLLRTADLSGETLLLTGVTAGIGLAALKDILQQEKPPAHLLILQRETPPSTSRVKPMLAPKAIFKKSSSSCGGAGFCVDEGRNTRSYFSSASTSQEEYREYHDLIRKAQQLATSHSQSRKGSGRGGRWTVASGTATPRTKIHVFQVDLSQPSQVIDVAEKIQRFLDQNGLTLDRIMLNAGVWLPGGGGGGRGKLLGGFDGLSSCGGGGSTSTTSPRTSMGAEQHSSSLEPHFVTNFLANAILLQMLVVKPHLAGSAGARTGGGSPSSSSSSTSPSSIPVCGVSRPTSGSTGNTKPNKIPTVVVTGSFTAFDLVPRCAGGSTPPTSSGTTGNAATTSRIEDQDQDEDHAPSPSSSSSLRTTTTRTRRLQCDDLQLHFSSRDRFGVPNAIAYGHSKLLLHAHMAGLSLAHPEMKDLLFVADPGVVNTGLHNTFKRALALCTGGCTNAAKAVPQEGDVAQRQTKKMTSTSSKLFSACPKLTLPSSFCLGELGLLGDTATSCSMSSFREKRIEVLYSCLSKLQILREPEDGCRPILHCLYQQRSGTGGNYCNLQQSTSPSSSSTPTLVADVQASSSSASFFDTNSKNCNMIRYMDCGKFGKLSCWKKSSDQEEREQSLDLLQEDEDCEFSPIHRFPGSDTPWSGPAVCGDLEDTEICQKIYLNVNQIIEKMRVERKENETLSATGSSGITKTRSNSRT